MLCAVLAAGLWLRRRRRRRPSGVEAAREAVRSLLARRTAKQVMVPRDRIDYLSLERPIADNLAVVEKTRRTRYPLCETGLDTISGVVHIKQLLPRLHTLTSSDELLLIQQPALFVPESQPLDVLLASFRAQRSGMAVVVDEHGIPTGIVTLDDVLEEIAGDVRDETAPATPPEFVETDNGVEVDGMVLVEDLCHRLSLESLRDGGLDTVGGYVCKALGR
ncbi:MAG: CBS domain-containing protein, partial [Deltaproteobacteria bacterium]